MRYVSRTVPIRGFMLASGTTTFTGIFFIFTAFLFVIGIFWRRSLKEREAFLDAREDHLDEQERLIAESVRVHNHQLFGDASGSLH